MPTPLEDALQNIWSSDYVQKNPNKAYKVSYDAEYLEVAEYLNGGARPDVAGYSKLGLGLVGVEDAIRAGSQPEPEPEPGELPFAEPMLQNPVSPSIPASQASFACEAGKDYLIDFRWQPRGNFQLTGSARRVQIRNLYTRIASSSYDGSGFNRNAININVKADHVAVTGMYTEPIKYMLDNITIACKPTTKVTLQNILIETTNDSREPSAHPDNLQIQGALGSLEIGLATFFATAAVGHGGKSLQFDILNALGETGGPFTVDMRKVDIQNQGNASTGAKTGVIIGKDDNDKIKLTMAEVYGIVGAAPGYGYSWENFCTNYPSALGKSISGSSPNRVMTFTNPSQGWYGDFREKSTSAAKFVTKASLGL